jgi:prepilin-type N-terminal cleavage/methylation domain-containing protein
MRSTIERAMRGPRRGFTLIELLVVMAIVALLASIAAPRYFGSLELARETSLRAGLAALREAIDQHAADRGKLPETLEDLVERRYLRELPEDPFTGRRDSWIALAPASEAFHTTGLADVRSGAAGRARDGSLYADW